MAAGTENDDSAVAVKCDSTGEASRPLMNVIKLKTDHFRDNVVHCLKV